MNANQEVDQMNRGAFLRSLGMSSAALMAFYCMGTGLTACSKSNNDPAPSGGTTGTGTTPTTTSGFTGNADPSKGAVNFTVDLTDANYKTLTTIGNYVYQNNIILARVKDGSYVALSKVCTHEGTTIQYIINEDDFYCPNHGSRFTNSGGVKNGPAASPVQQFKTSLNTDSTKLTVTA